MIDNLDKRILEIMKKDSRCPYVEIADKLGVSEGLNAILHCFFTWFILLCHVRDA